MISDSSELKNYAQVNVSDADKQTLQKVAQENQLIKQKVKKYKKPTLSTNARPVYFSHKLYSTSVPHKLYAYPMARINALRLALARLGGDAAKLLVTGVNARRIVTTVVTVLAVLLILGLGAVLAVNGFSRPNGEGDGPDIIVDPQGDISLSVYRGDNLQADGVVKEDNYEIDTIRYTKINEHISVTNTSNEDLYILLYTEIVPADETLDLDCSDLYIALDEVSTKFTFENGVLYTAVPLTGGSVFRAFNGLGICLYSDNDIDFNKWAKKTVNVVLHFEAFGSIEDLNAKKESITSSIYSVNGKDVTGAEINNENLPLKEKLK